MSTFVSTKELKAQYGVGNKKLLKEILTANGVGFQVDTDGWAFTTLDAINAAMGIGKKIEKKQGVNLDWMKHEKP